MRNRRRYRRYYSRARRYTRRARRFYTRRKSGLNVGLIAIIGAVVFLFWGNIKPILGKFIPSLNS